MKKILFLGVALLAFMGAKAESYSMVEISYDNTQLMAGGTDVKDAWGKGKGNTRSMNGFGLQYSYGIGLGEKPMNVEVGLKWNMVFWGQTEKESGFEVSDNMNLMRLAIPVSYIYHFNINDDFKIAPYAGIDFRFNLLAQDKYTVKYNGQKDSETYSFFDKKIYGDNTWKRFQMGWHIGLRFEYTRFFLGLEYGTDFMPIESEKYTYGNTTYKFHINTGNLALGVGCYF